jgi:hypothetical protein
MVRFKIIFVLLFSTLYVQCMACSGEIGINMMWRNEHFGKTSFAVCIALGLVTIAVQVYLKLFRSSFLYNPILIILLIAFHPNNWLGVDGGDCGYALYDFSIYAIVGVGLIVAITGIKAGKTLQQIRVPKK